MNDDKAFQQTVRDDLQFRQQRRTAEPGIVHDALDCQKIVPVDDGFMVIPVMTLGLFSPVLEGLLVVNICRKLGEPLAGQHISAVTLVPHTGCHTGCRPLQIPQIRPLAQLREDVCDLLGGISVQVHIEHELRDLVSLRVDNELAVLVLHKTQQFRGQRQAMVQPHPQGSFHAPAAGTGFLLCNGGLKRQCHVRIIVQGVDCFRLKQHADFLLRQLADDAQAVHHITGKTRNIFYNDQVDFSGIRICQHLIKPIPMLHGSAGFSFVCVDLHQHPLRMLCHQLFVILLLQLKGCGLHGVVCGNTGVDGDLLILVGFHMVVLLLRRDVLVFIRINRGLRDALPHPILLLGIGQFCLFHSAHSIASASSSRLNCSICSSMAGFVRVESIGSSSSSAGRGCQPSGNRPISRRSGR